MKQNNPLTKKQIKTILENTDEMLTSLMLAISEKYEGEKEQDWLWEFDDRWLEISKILEYIIEDIDYEDITTE